MFRHEKLSLAASAALLLAAPDAWAAEIQELSPVVVEDHKALSGKTAEQPAHSRFALPASVEAVETLTREDIAALRPRDVSDLLEGALGMSISRQGARVHNFSYDRGDNVSIILDGVYLTQSAAQRALGDIPVEMIDSVRFVRDATVITVSPLMSFGSASAGSPNQGAIIIETRRGRSDKTGSEVRASYGNFDTGKLSAFTGHAWQDGRYTLGAGYQRSQSAGKEGLNNAYGADTFLLNGGFHDRELSASASLYINQADREIQRATGTYTGATNFPVSGPTPNGVLDKNIWHYKPIDSSALAFTLVRPWNDAQTTALTWGSSEVKGTGYYYTTLNNNVAGQRFKDHAEEWNLSHTVRSGSNTAKLGLQEVDWYQLSEGGATARKESVYGAYLTDEFRITPAWAIDAAYREDYKYIRQGGDKYLSSGNKVTLSNGTWTDSARVLSLGSGWQIDRTWRISARYSYNRTPTPDVLTTRNDAGLPDEKRARYEFGLEADFSPALLASLTPFYYDIRNAKVADGSITKNAAGQPLVDAVTGLPTSITVYKAANRIRHGFELSLKGRLLENRFAYELGWTHFNDNGDDGINGSEFPDNKYSARFNWRQGAWNGTLSLLHVDPYLSYGYTVGDFTTVNLNIARELGHGVTLALYGQNLTDERYGTNNKGYPATANWGVLRDVGATYGIEMGVKF